MSDKTIVVFDFRPISTILELGGSQAWSLKPVNAARCRFLVVVRNRYHGNARPEPEPHGTPILVGKNLKVERWPDAPGRFIVRFGEFALVESETPIWPGNRNPVWYIPDIHEIGIDPAALNWQPSSGVSQNVNSGVSEISGNENKPLSKEAKMTALETEVKGLRELLAEVRASRDELRQDRDEWRRRAERLPADKGKSQE
jgi:hypothetical protein